MAATGSHRIAWQRGNLAIYAEATIGVERACSAARTGLVRGMETVAEQWRTGVIFGLCLLRESLTGRVELDAVSVTITSFDGVPCDTTLTAAAFVSFHAAAKALDVDVSEVFKFDDSTGAFQIQQ